MVKVHIITDRTYRYDKRCQNKLTKGLIKKVKTLSYENEKIANTYDRTKDTIRSINISYNELLKNYTDIYNLLFTEQSKNKALSEEYMILTEKYDSLLQEYVDLEIENENENENENKFKE